MYSDCNTCCFICHVHRRGCRAYHFGILHYGYCSYLLCISHLQDSQSKEKILFRYIVSYGYQELKFDIKTQVHINTPYSPRYLLYKSKEDCEYILETERRRRAISDRLCHLLTRKEVNDIYNFLILRDKKM